MTEKEKVYFTALSKDRTENADTLEKPSMRGTKKSVVEKYSDQAHFIYELIQNADDAGATSARFNLHEDKLIFAHNGTICFSISDPETEDEDKENGTLGDINSITSIGNSNKPEPSIGKFGVGFKAVFQYSNNPSIYDPNIFFKIERFIVPCLVDNDYEGRKENETLFVFPFDHPDRTPEEAFDDISDKLCSLVYPLLFINNLENISIEIPDHKVNYGKSIYQNIKYNDTDGEFICLTKNNGDNINIEKLWLFSRIDKSKRKYSVGFFVDEDGFLKATQHPAFCFFPTKETTGLNFIIHAPFLLTDSREGIRASVPHNKNMVELLAKLAADSLVYLKEIGQNCGKRLIDDKIFDIIPYNKNAFNNVNDRIRISFMPFYTEILGKFQNEELLPSKDGYTTRKNAYWASVPKITEIFSNSQLSEITSNPNAKWVFISFGRDDELRSGNKTRSDYIDSITHVWLNEDDIFKGWSYENGTRIKGISETFIESQSFDWLHKFYKWISETRGRINLIRDKPIFLDKNGKAVSAYDSYGKRKLYLPSDSSDNYTTIHPELLKDKNTEELIKNHLDIQEPSLWDEINNKILPLYNNVGNIDTLPHFKKFFQYFLRCPHNNIGNFISKICNISFVLFTRSTEENLRHSKPSELYFPNEDLIAWFKYKPETKFICLDIYKDLVGANDCKEKEDQLSEFLTRLGVKSRPHLMQKELTWEDREALAKKTHLPPRELDGRNHTYTEWQIDGCMEFINEIINKFDKNLSFEFWKLFIKPGFIEYRGWQNGIYSWYYYHSRSKPFFSSETIRLRTEPWLLNTESEFKAAKELTLKTLSPEYDTDSNEAHELLRILEIGEKIAEVHNLTNEQQTKIDFFDKYPDIPQKEFELFAEQYRAKNQKTETVSTVNNDISTSPDITRVAKEVAERSVTSRKQRESGTTTDKIDDMDCDEDDYIKPTVNFSKKIDRAKQRSADEIENIVRLEQLEQKALECEKYSFEWFRVLLELEAINSRENNAGSREITISFAKAEREPGTTRTLILKHPNRYIPHSMEDLADIPLELHFQNKPTIKVAIEVVNVKSYTLRVKLKPGAEIDGVDLLHITEAKIVATNPVFLIKELRKAYNELEFNDDYNLQKNLCKNIEFVFGPPGTGKTTYLANNYIIPIMQEPESLKILVLTPTNKAADVLTSRIMNSMGSDDSYQNWLIRFGTTNDDIIEQNGVFRDKTFDIRTFQRNVTVTTIARFPYDYFLPDESTRLHLNELKWDYIIIDEASMIPVANIVYPLFKKTPKKFIIAGDPFQIEPITSVDIWKDENIYTMVKLSSFTNPNTVPYQYHVELLTTQYRSIPEIGNIFSKFAYGGVLQHDRKTESQKPLLINDVFDIKSLNIIKFPVSKYESIYRSKKLQGKSNYHIYSALFAFEFTKRLSSLITAAHKNDFFKIGVIAPYRAQADLIDKLFSSISTNKNIDIQVGTIHGFQGDECDIVIAVFNTPPSISTSPEMFLNKPNIINVSISRARDYLFILMPNDETENVQNLSLIKKIESLCIDQLSYAEKQSNDVEKIIFGSNSYLEDNSFSTSHQLVNVYGEPEQRYEIRSEDSAIDIQIHKPPH